MITDDAYLALRRRFRASGEIDRELYDLLLRLARTVVFASGLPPALSPTGHWDREAAHEAAHGWIGRRLLQTNALLAAFDYADNARPFLRSLEQNFRHYLFNERAGSELDNLVSRTAGLMREDKRFTDWVKQARAADTWWGLASWNEPSPYQGADEPLVSHAWAVGEVVILRYSQRVERASPVLASAELGRFLERLFERVAALLTLRHLAMIYGRRFDLGQPPALELTPDAIEEFAGEEPADDEAIRNAALAVAAELSDRQFEVLLRRSERQTLDEIAGALGISRGTADNELKRLGPIIDRYCVDGVTRELILEKLLDALS